MRRMVIVWVGMVCLMATAMAKGQNKNYQEYIEMYKELAISEMEKFHIPASITLAQGLLESSAGRSTLAKYYNNHFGIKCGRSWNGAKTYHHDDRPNECFREYDHAKQSYEDHSLFLTRNPRYAPLFRLEMTDYKAWAHGLKKAGYATNPCYGELLVRLIEDYELYEYDHMKIKKSTRKTTEVKVVKVVGNSKKQVVGEHRTYITNDIVYVVARKGDTWNGLAKELGIAAKKLVKYNDLYEGYKLRAGDIVYLKKKNKKAEVGKTAHVVRAGESMHSISQKYGIRLKNLYKMNKMDGNDDMPEPGRVLRIR